MSDQPKIGIPPADQWERRGDAKDGHPIALVNSGFVILFHPPRHGWIGPTVDGGDEAAQKVRDICLKALQSQ
jgi:hypothetical protein